MLEVMMRVSKNCRIPDFDFTIPKYVLCILLIVLGCEVPEFILEVYLESSV